VSTLLYATVYIFLHNLLNVLEQIANKMGLQKNSTYELSGNEKFQFKKTATPSSCSEH
jgi:hypothetical protein